MFLLTRVIIIDAISHHYIRPGKTRGEKYFILVKKILKYVNT